MKKKHKIYAVAGMMEYQTIVKVGKNSVKVNFSGGSISNGCMQPARFSTKNLIIQNAIEASDEFMKGRIRLERTIPLNEEIKVERNNEEPKVDDDVRPQAESSAASGKTADIFEEDPKTQSQESSVENASEDTCAESPSIQTEPEEVEVTCKDVAKQYLQDHYGEKPSPLRTWEDVQNCAAKYNIVFKSPTLG